MILLRLKFLINGIADFDIVNLPFLDGDVPRSISNVFFFIFLNLFVLLLCPVMSMTLILGIRF